MKQNGILVMGDSNIDLIVQGLEQLPRMGQEIFVDRIETHSGGSAANVAVSLAKLGQPAALHSFQGRDEFGEKIRRQFARAGLDGSYIRMLDDKPTGITIAVSDQHDRFFISDMGANKLYDPLDFPAADFENFRHVHLSLYHIGLLEAYRQVARLARGAGCTVSLDLGWTEFDDEREDLLSLLQDIDVFFPNINEARYLCGPGEPVQLAEKLGRYVRGPVVVTLGGEGACCLDGSSYCECAFAVPARDAVGAGDAFDAGFLQQYVAGADLWQCLLHGSACGAIAVSATGAAASPTKAQLEEFLRHNTPRQKKEEVRRP